MKANNARSRRKFIEELRLNKIYSRPGPHSFIVVLDGLKATYNVGKIFRSAQAFGAAAVHLIGLEKFNPFPAQGALRYVPLCFHNTFAECYAQLAPQGYEFFALHASSSNKELFNCSFPTKTAFVLGHEAFGLSFDPKDYPSLNYLRIPMYSQIESLNVSIAASIAMYEYIRQAKPTKELSNEQNL